MNEGAELNRLNQAEVAVGAAFPRLARAVLLRGCNPYHNRTVIRAEIALGSFAGLRTAALRQDFEKAFIDAFKPDAVPLQGRAIPPGFLQRLASPEGVPIEEALLEAVLAIDSLALSVMFNVDPIGFATLERVSGATALVWETHVPALSRGAADLAATGIAELAGFAPTSGPSFNGALRHFLDRAIRRRLSGSTAVLKAAALRRGVPCHLISGQHLVLGQGSRQEQLFSSLTGATSFGAAKLALDKRQCNRRLASLSLPVPQQIGVGDADAAVAALAAVGAPAVLKPLKGNQGRGVTVGVREPDEVRLAFKRAFAEESGVLVEEWVRGTDYRLVVVGGRFVAAITSSPAEVAGDGRRSIRALVAELNAEEDRDDIRLSPVPIDAELDLHLTRQGLSLDSVLDAGSVATLAVHGHVATGGIPHDVTDSVHPDNRQLAERAAMAVGLDVAGVDMVMPDITCSYREVGGKILEVNTRPGLAMHAWPRSGRPRDVAGAIVELLFPNSEGALVPTLVIAGDRSTREAGQQAAQLLGTDGARVGLALKDGAYLNGMPIDMPRSRISRGASILLREPTLDVLVAAISLRRLATNGLGLDGCDGVAVLQEPGSDAATARAGLEVVRRANRGSFVIAIGDRVARETLQDLAADRIVLVGEDPQDPDILAHRAAGGWSVLRHWTPRGPKMRLEKHDEIFAETPIIGRAGARHRIIVASMFAFGLVRAYDERQVVPKREQELGEGAPKTGRFSPRLSPSER